MAADDALNLDRVLQRLPDPVGAKVFLERLGERWPEVRDGLNRNAALLSRVLTLAAYSPFLSEVILANPQHVTWLGGQRSGLDRVKSTEQLSEELARFRARAVIRDHQKTLVEFKHREYLRIYLRDCLALATLSEVTEELSNLADLIIREALSIAETEQSRIHGYPLTKDDKGRIARAEIAVIALGKLGCRELNYSSDIDLFFVYSGQGETSGAPASVSRASKGAVTNKEFFTRVAERVVDLVGGTGEGGRPVYRVDLRLRPYGRDGDLVWPVENAIEYYRGPAKTWERQALIRARACGGGVEAAAQFIAGVENAVFHANRVSDAIADIDRMKQRVQQKQAPGGGFNVKLGGGGIREIEFITQALQLRFGAREPWIRPAQILIVLGRLCDKGFLSGADRASLSAAYTFLRTVEHRIQMDQGAQTHTITPDPAQLELLARRCGYLEAEDPAGLFINDLKKHTEAVEGIYARIVQRQTVSSEQGAVARAASEGNRLTQRVAEGLANIVSRSRLSSPDSKSRNAEEDPISISRALEAALDRSINPSRALRNLGLWVEALATAPQLQEWAGVFSDPSQVDARLKTLSSGLVLTLGCHYLANILLSRPRLAFEFINESISSQIHSADEFAAKIDGDIDNLPSIGEKADSLRRAWYPLMLGIGYRDLLGSLSSGTEPGCTTDACEKSESDEFTSREAATDQVQMGLLRRNNLEQTALAEAVLRKATGLAANSVGLETLPQEDLPLAVLGLGRLGHTGMDYGSDLDLLVVYDEKGRWPGADSGQDPAEASARFTAELVRILSSVTRDGTLYRVDLRLRPEGNNGHAALSLHALEAYISGRASAWEHSAYLKLREVAGNQEFGNLVRQRAVRAALDAASRNQNLGAELRAIRTRLEKEKAKARRPDIKFGPGGMTDVYFITRYLQLRDGVYFPPEHGTQRLIRHLGSVSILSALQAEILHQGYFFLRRLDHWMRLLSDQPSSTLPSSMVVLDDIAKVLGLGDGSAVIETYSAHASNIRRVFHEIFG